MGWITPHSYVATAKIMRAHGDLGGAAAVEEMLHGDQLALDRWIKQGEFMFRTDTGFDAEQLAMLGAKAYMRAGGTIASTADWDQLGDTETFAWCNVGNKVLHQLESEDGLKFSEVVRKIYGWWAMPQGKDPLEWDTLPMEERVAWEAATRHLAWCLNCDDAAEGHDVGMWEQWAKEQLERRK